MYVVNEAALLIHAMLFLPQVLRRRARVHLVMKGTAKSNDTVCSLLLGKAPVAVTCYLRYLKETGFSVITSDYVSVRAIKIRRENGCQ